MFGGQVERLGLVIVVGRVDLRGMSGRVWRLTAVRGF